MSATELLVALGAQDERAHVYCRSKPQPHLFFSSTTSQKQDRQRVQRHLQNVLIVPAMGCRGTAAGLSELNLALEPIKMMTVADLKQALATLVDCEIQLRRECSIYYNVWITNAKLLELNLSPTYFNVVRRMFSWVPRRFDRHILSMEEHLKLVREALAQLPFNERVALSEIVRIMETDLDWELGDWERVGSAFEMLRMVRGFYMQSMSCIEAPIRHLPPPSRERVPSEPIAPAPVKSERKRQDRKSWRLSFKSGVHEQTTALDKSGAGKSQRKAHRGHEKTFPDAPEAKADAWEAAKKKRSTAKAANPKRVSAPVLLHSVEGDGTRQPLAHTPDHSPIAAPRLTASSAKKREKSKH